MRTDQLIKRKQVVLGLIMIVGTIMMVHYDPEWYTYRGIARSVPWLFTYQDGLVSRSFMGSVMRMLFPEHYGSFLIIRMVSLMGAVLLSAQLAILCYIFWLRTKEYSLFLIGCVLLASPGTVQFYASQSGLFDQWAYCLIMICIAAMTFMKNTVLALVLMSITAAVSVLIHEAQLLMGVPVLIACYIIRQRKVTFSKMALGKALMQVAIAMLPCVMVAMLIITLGRDDFSDKRFQEIVADLQSGANFEVNSHYVMVQFRSLEENVSYMLKHLLLISRVVNLMYAILALLPSGMVAAMCLKQARKGAKPEGLIVSMMIWGCCFAPLLLCVVGQDYPRWFSFVVLNLFIVAMYSRIAIELNAENPLWQSRPISNVLLVVIIAVSLIVGPVTTTKAPQSLEKVSYITECMIRAIVGRVQ